VAGGYNNTAIGDESFAAGINAQALHTGSSVWADASIGDFPSSAANQFSVRAAGGVRFVTAGAGRTVDGQATVGDMQLGAGSSDYHQREIGGGNSSGFLYGSYQAFGDGIHMGYNYYADAGGGHHIIRTDAATSRITAGYGFVSLGVGGVNRVPLTDRLVANTSGVTVTGTFNNNSDRNAKQDFAPVSASEILAKVAQLPIAEWSYKVDSATRHIGPMAQDFYSVFNIGTDDKHIAPIDEGGVALAAIQGLNQKLTEELKQKETEMTELKQRFEALERLVHSDNRGRE
jgi:hypothetical protein